MNDLFAYSWLRVRVIYSRIDIVVIFLGDGATEEGHVIESMNMASLYNLPVLFVIENNS